MNYLKYVEHSAENLQFYLWYRDYCSRFDNLPESERSLSPEWTKSDADAALHSPPRKANAIVTQILKDTVFAESKVAVDRVDPFHTPPESPSPDDDRADDASDDYCTTSATTLVSPQAAAETAFDNAGMKWMPCMSFVTSTCSH